MKNQVAALIFLGSVMLVRADQMIEGVQQALKDQGFYYGEITGETNANLTAAVRRYQIRNGLQVNGELNSETLRSLGIDSSGSARSAAKSSSPTRRKIDSFIHLTASPPVLSQEDSLLALPTRRPRPMCNGM